MINNRLLTGFLAAAICIGAVAQKPSTDPLIQRKFDDKTDLVGWTKLRESDKIELVTRANNPNDVRSGEGALCYSFAANGTGFPVAYLQVGDLTGMKALDLWFKTDATTVVYTALSDKDGESYGAIVYCPGHQWTHATIPIEDFAFDPNTKKANGKLDLDKLNGIAFLDVLAVFVTDENMKLFLGDHGGLQRICIDDLQVLPMYNGKMVGTAAVPIDLFSRNYLCWMPFREVNLSQGALAGAVSGQGVRAEYDRAPGKLPAWLRNIAPGSLDNIQTVSFKVASAQEIQLYVGLEETDGGKWRALVSVPGGNSVQTLNLKLADFQPADDTKDPDHKLSPGQIKMISFYDGTVDPGKNTITIGELVGKK